MRGFTTALMVLAAAAGCSGGRTYSQQDLRDLSAGADSTHVRVVSDMLNDTQLADRIQEPAPGRGRFESCKGSDDKVGYVVESQLVLPPTSVADVKRAVAAAFDEAGVDKGEFRGNQFRGVKDGVAVDVTVSGPGSEIVGLATATSSQCMTTSTSIASTLTSEAPHDVR